MKRATKKSYSSSKKKEMGMPPMTHYYKDGKLVPVNLDKKEKKPKIKK